jgi:general secretion pathway protein K
MTRPSELGVILVNVLVALALCAALVSLMLTSQDGAIDRTQRAAAVAQAEAIALGAETSVLVALRRDMLEAPEADHYGEPWAQAAQTEISLETGRFAVQIQDAQARLDLNGLRAGGLAQVQTLFRLVAELELPPETADRIAAAMREEGPITRLGQIPGLDAESRAQLEPFVAFLPRPAPVNLNTADALLLGVLFQNRIAARRLSELRERNGALSPEDILSLGLVPSGTAGFQSDIWDVTILAEVDGVALSLTSRLVRQQGLGGGEVIVVSRQFGLRPADELPPLPLE